MKKFLKGVMGVASVTAVAAGVYYLAKKWMDEQDEDLEDDLDEFEMEDDDESREYVTLDIEDDDEDYDDGDYEEEESISEEDIAETESTADFENVVMTDASTLPEEEEQAADTESAPEDDTTDTQA